MKIILLALFTTWVIALRLPNYATFKQFMHTYEKNYENDAVFLYRFLIYSENQVTIKILNDNPQDHAIYGDTKITDLTYEQVKEIMGLRVPANQQIRFISNFTNDPNYKPRSNLPDIWNWVQQGVVTGIKDQGTCGSCWTFSTVGNIESLNALKTKQLTDLSEQQLIDCDKSNFGCGGGWPYAAIDWLATHNGLMTAKDYPLRTNYSGPCLFKDQASKIQIAGYQNITHDEAIIRDALYEKGPLSILLDFTGLMHYKSGVANPKFCSTWPDHALVLVGYGIQEQDYWLIKNSWGVKWGINGYFMLKRGANKCAINLWATTAVLV